MRMDAYIRVSRVAGREGERFISPQDQRKKIEAWAALHEVEIVTWWEEIDQSGSKLDRPMFQQALARCEHREADGIVVAKLDRFARSAADALLSIKRLNEAGARLASVEDGFDGSTAMGRFAIGILLLIAELELERISGNWSTAVTQALDRGVYISARPPTGYRRREDGRLEIDPSVGPLVQEVFRRRGAGVTPTAIAKWLTSTGAPTPKGGSVWVAQTVRNILRNSAYLGHARQGELVNEEAHAALITREEFEAAQQAPSVRSTKDGSLASQCLLGGFLHCAGCGHKLRIGAGTETADGKKLAVYSCRKRYSTGICPGPAAARAQRLDTYVEGVFLAELARDHGIAAEAVGAHGEIDQVLLDIAEADRDLAAYLANVGLLRIIGEGRWNAQLKELQGRLDLDRFRLAELRAQTGILDGLTPGDLIAAWRELTIVERRKILHGFVDRVVLRRQAGGRRRFDPARIQIIWRSNVVAESPTTSGAGVM